MERHFVRSVSFGIKSRVIRQLQTLYKTNEFCCLRALNDFNLLKIINIFLEAVLITEEWLILSNRKKNKKKSHILLISKYKDFSKLFENSRENSLVSTSEFSDKLKFRNKLEFIYKSQSAMWLWRTSKNDKNSKILKWKFEECGTWWHDSFLLCLGLRFDWREPWWPMSYGNAKYCSRNHRSHSTKRF